MNDIQLAFLKGKMQTTVVVAFAFGLVAVANANPGDSTEEVRIVSSQGIVLVSNLSSKTWTSAKANQLLHAFDSLKTGPNSRAALRWSNRSVMYFDSLTEAEIVPPSSPDSQPGLHLIRGMISFFHRDQPGRIKITTSGAVAGVDGTEFVMGVDNSDRTSIYVLDGMVNFGNQRTTDILTNGQQAFVDVGGMPIRAPGFIVNNVLQWAFYYPAVLNPNELVLTDTERNSLKESLDLYRAGDLLAALRRYASTARPESDDERVYHAALLLSTGQIKAAELELSIISTKQSSERLERLSAAIRELIASVKRETVPTLSSLELSTELLAHSYYEQSRAVPRESLQKALNLARQSVKAAPDFGFAWERLAELEFSFGHIENAIEALNNGLRLSPRNAQALALEGFLLAAQNKPHEAIAVFDSSIAVDSALGNAWLGRGLCRIKVGLAAAGQEDLLVAAALEPQRAELRAYLGKAYANANDYQHAFKELRLAIKLDPNDPTAWFYSALLDQEENRINEAMRNLENSESLNENRNIYRSQLLLDEDGAVRTANLAGIYKDAGMDNVAINEAQKAVAMDYANYSAHLFLANSYSQLVDPNEIGLRYETARENEYLLANLLSPAAAGTMSQTISQNEYTRLFERNQLGVVSQTEYLSRGAWRQTGAQYGIDGNSSYEIDGNYSLDPGQRPNDDFQERSVNVLLKQQLTPRDSSYIQIFDYDANGGDVHQYDSPNMANLNYRFQETQEPTALLGYHREWTPGINTLLLFARINDTYSYTNSAQPVLVDLLGKTRSGSPFIKAVHGIVMNEVYQNQSTIYSGEIQHIWQAPERSTIIGGRAQYGNNETLNLQSYPSSLSFYFPDPPAPAVNQDIGTYFQRVSLYGYQQWQFIDSMRLYGGLTFDWMRYPLNFQTVPVSANEQSTDRLSPKAGLIWSPNNKSVARLAYTRSLGGVSMDQSYQIEPSEIAGFVQSFRSVIPESVAAENPGAGFESYGISLEQKLRSDTYLIIDGQLLNSHVLQNAGAFAGIFPEFPYAVPSGLKQELDYHEKSLQATAYHRMGEDWSLGAQYRISRSDLRSVFPNVPSDIPLFNFSGMQWTEATLQQAELFAVYNNPIGFFARAEALWNGQTSVGYTPTLPDANFWQFNTYIGYRFRHRQAELKLGLLNMTDRTYNLNPLNPHQEFPYQRTLSMRLQLGF